MKTKLVCVLFFSLLALSILPAGFYLRDVAAQTKPKIRIEPVQTMKVAVDETFTVNVTVEDCVNIYAVQVYIRYDPEVLEAVSILEGPFLPSFGSTLLLLNETKEDLEATPPYAEVRFADTLMGDVPGANGSGLLFNVTFGVLSGGSSHLRFVEYTPKSGGDGTYFMDRNLNEIYLDLYDAFYGTPITLSASPAKVSVGDNVTLSGQVLGVTGALNVSILFRKAGGEWSSLATLTDVYGNFSYVWNAGEAGNFEFKVSTVIEDVPVQSGMVAVTVESPFNIMNYILYIVVAVIVILLLAVFYARRRGRKAPPEMPPSA